MLWIVIRFIYILLFFSWVTIVRGFFCHSTHTQMPICTYPQSVLQKCLYPDKDGFWRMNDNINYEWLSKLFTYSFLFCWVIITRGSFWSYDTHTNTHWHLSIISSPKLPRTRKIWLLKIEWGFKTMNSCQNNLRIPPF